jgi:ABC-2 type transport system ATP-binding protein
MSGPAVAEFEDIGKVYHTGLLGRGRRMAVEHVTFRIEPGEVFCLLGPNRAGKTTLVKILLSLCQPTTGRGTRFDRPLADRQTLARIGYMHENPAFPRYLTAPALLEYFGALSLLTEPVVKERVPKLLERVGLADRAEEPISRFSKGMIQRLGIAQALLNEPDLLVFDEPSEGLDLAGRQLVRDVVRTQKQQGKAVLFVSHVLNEVEQIGDRVGVLVAGKLAFLGTMADLLKDKQTGTPRNLDAALQPLYAN